MYECPNCGGNLTFDIPSQSLHCEFCESQFDPYVFENRTSGREVTDSEEMDMTVFRCPECGAEIASTNLSATGFCTYCGAAAVFEKRIRGEARPRKIIPFRKTKEDCKTAYGEALRGMFYAPVELRDPAFLERFVGVYMPYWIYDVSVGPEVRIKGKKTSTKGNYQYTDHFNLSAEVDASYRQISYDASSSFDDHINEAIAPFPEEEIRDFSPGFLAGFFSDIADVPMEIYLDDAETAVGKDVFERLETQFPEYELEIPQSQVGLESSLSMRTEAHRAMFPVWFLTYRKGDRVAYSVVNGQTGKVYADVPVDLRRFLLVSLILTIPVFVMANLKLTITASWMLTFSAVFALLSSFVYYREMETIRKQEMREEDQGFIAGRNPLGKEAKRLQTESFKKLKTKNGRIGNVIASLFVGVVAVFYGMQVVAGIFAFLSLLFSSADQLLLVAMLVGTAAVTILNRKNFAAAGGGRAGAYASIAAVLLALLIRVVNPVQDLAYYAGSAAVFLCILVTVVSIIQRYNLLATRPVPEFHERSRTKPGGTNAANAGGGTSAAQTAGVEKTTEETGTAGAGKTGRKSGRKTGAADVGAGALEGGRRRAERPSGNQKNPGRHPFAIILALIGIVLLIIVVSYLAVISSRQNRYNTVYTRAAAAAAAAAEQAGETDSGNGADAAGISGYVYRNPDTGYRVYIQDAAELLTESEKKLLTADMQGITLYGNVGFASGYSRSTSARWFAEDCYQEAFGTDSGTMFVIDMDDREIRIHSDGELYRRYITDGYANTITDNTYRYAGRGDYYGCAREAFTEIFQVLEGQRIAQPMKYASNALLALILALLLNYAFLRFSARGLKPGRMEMLAAVNTAYAAGRAAATFERQTKVYVSSGSSGRGGGFRGGGGGGFRGGGGGHSGGGGGHRF